MTDDIFIIDELTFQERLELCFKNFTLKLENMENSIKLLENEVKRLVETAHTHGIGES